MLSRVGDSEQWIPMNLPLHQKAEGVASSEWLRRVNELSGFRF